MHGSARRLALPVAVLLLAAGPGCSRKFFRERADQDVEGIITQKNVFPSWSVKNWYVYPHPDARFADPFNPDRPPYPADDPASRLLSPNPQHPTRRTGVGRVDGEGYLHLLQQWDAENRAEDAGDNPARGAPPAGPARITEPLAPKLSAAPRTPDAGQWVSAKPRVVVGAEPTTPAGPQVTESHGPVVPAAGGGPEGGVVPAVATEPAAQPPTVLPEISTTPETQPQQQPEKLPGVPKPVDPKQPDTKQPEPKQPDAKVPSGQFPSLEQLSSLGGSDADYLRALYSNQQGFRLRLDQAVALGLINSREFQDRREDLYLAALPVSLARYNFAAQAFFTEQVVRDFTGSRLSDAGRLWSLNTTAGFGKNFATGASLVARLANQVVIDLGSNRPDVAVSNFSLSLIQPFLQGGGLAVNLENLTGNERNLLYAMRSYARFRKLFYVATVAGPGGNITNNPYGLQGLSVNLGRGIGGNLTAPSVGFLPLLQQIASITNQQKNVVFLERLLLQYQAYAEGGQLADLQVGQVEVQLLNSRGALLGTAGGAGGGGGGGAGIRGYLDSLDNFKLQLGLPMTVGLDLDAALLKVVREQLAQFEDIYADLRQLEATASQFDPKLTLAEQRARWRRLLTESELSKGTAFAKGIAARWDAWAKLSNDQISDRMADLSKQRNVLLDRRAERRLKNQPEPPEELRKLEEIESELELGRFERAVREYETQPWLKAKAEDRVRAQGVAFRRTFNAFFIVALGARNERLAETTTRWPKLPGLPVGGTDVLTSSLDEGYTACVQAALSSRLDLMNARGQVVDAYRQIAVTANSLQGVFDVEYDFNATTPPGDNRPFAFSADRSSQRLTFRTELPLVRRAERNNYRAALVAYQRQRRTLMAFEDNIANDVRSDIRQLRTIAELYRIQQRVVELGYSQVDSARETLFAPLAANQALDPAQQAALTNQLLQNQSGLLTAQNTLYNLWVNYLTARMKLYLDTELMQLDDRGVWIDEQAPGTPGPARNGPLGERERLPAPQPVGAPEGR